jgi:hypothetical protein
MWRTRNFPDKHLLPDPNEGSTSKASEWKCSGDDLLGSVNEKVHQSLYMSASIDKMVDSEINGGHDVVVKLERAVAKQSVMKRHVLDTYDLR